MRISEGHLVHNRCFQDKLEEATAKTKAYSLEEEKEVDHGFSEKEMTK